MDISLLRKYNVPGPRYTSYPTVPHWDQTLLQQDTWMEQVLDSFKISNESEGISLYIHLPYCESLCTYCGCNTRITVNHKVEMPYIEALLKEWNQYLDAFDTSPQIRELHIGGGTPTFFSPGNLQFLISSILDSAHLMEDAVLGFEGHPNNTLRAHLQTLFDLGFRRVSLGIQDFDPEVQRIINRVQPFENVKNVTEVAREIGYTSINFDLIYGLPKQKVSSVIDTVHRTLDLRPDRIAFYSYAHVPWIKPGQRMFTELDLPQGEEKRKLYEIGREMLLEAGYKEIGMDHFALEDEALYIAHQNRTMYRNFMGYSPVHTRMMIGLGTSAISDAWTAFAQNEKKVEDYIERINSGVLPIFRGHLLSQEELLIRKHILNLMCHYETQWEGNVPILEEGQSNMAELEADGLVVLTKGKILITSKGEPFVRNVCMALDPHIKKVENQAPVFSKTV